MSQTANIQDLETGTIGDRIRAARRRGGLNQGDLAIKLGVSQPTVANWESGIHDPRQLMLAKIAEALEVSLGWLASGERSQSEKDKHPAAAYLRRLVVHVPVIPLDSLSAILTEATPDFHAFAVDYIPVTAGSTSLIAIFMRDEAMNLAFPGDTLVVIDYEEHQPSEGSIILFQNGDHAPLLRRFRSGPMRLEPISSDPNHETIFVDKLDGVIGTVFVSIRFH